MASNDEMPISELFEPSLVRTNSYSKAMNGGAAKLHFGASMFNSPDLTGVTKHFKATFNKTTDKDSFGFSVGTCDDGTHIVHYVTPGSMADAVLEEDDEIDIVDKELANKMSHDALVSLMTKSKTMTLQITRTHDHYVDVVLTKVNDSFGLSVGSQDQSHIFVSDVVPGGAADGKIEPGDIIVAINGTLVGSLMHQEAVDSISSGEKVRLTVCRSEESKAMAAANLENKLAKHVVHVTITRESTSAPFGIGVGEAVDGSHIISETSEAAESAGLWVADQLLEVNDKNVDTMKHDKLIEFMSEFTTLNMKLNRQLQYSLDPEKRQKGAIKVLKEKDIKTSPATPNTTVTLDRETLEKSYGFGIGTMDDGVKVVTSVESDGIAAKLLQVNDEIVTINGDLCLDLSHEEVVERAQKGTVVELEIARGDGTHVDLEKRIAERRESSEVPDETLVKTPPAEPNATIKLDRKDLVSSFGFSFGTLDDEVKLVTSVDPEGIAAHLLKANDELVSINGVVCIDIEHDKLVAMVQKETVLEIEVSRGDGSREAFEKSVIERRLSVGIPTFVTDDGKFHIILERPDKETSFGFGLGTADDGHAYVTEVADNGLADKEGLKADDEICLVNGTEVTGQEHEVIVAMIIDELKVDLYCGRPDSVSADVDDAKDDEVEESANDEDEKDAEVFNTLSKFIASRSSSSADVKKQTKIVEISRPDLNSGYGFGIGTLEDGGQVITKLSPAREEEGQLQIADEIISINGASATSMSHDELIEVICKETDLEIAIVRVVDKSKPPLERGASISAMGTSVSQRQDDIGN